MGTPMTDGSARYTAAAIDHFTRPRYLGRLEDADGVGRIDDPTSDTMITMYLKLVGRSIGEARFRALGCSACIAAGSVATELVGSRDLERALEIDAEAILDALGGLPPDQAYCAHLTAQALREAVEQASRAAAG